MKKLNRPLTMDDIISKEFPFACENCGNKPTPEKVITFDGACEICGASVIAYTIDTAECIINLRGNRS